MTLGEKIKKARKELKITQDELCENVITRNMLSAIECNKANPSLNTLKHIAKKLNIPISYLVTDDDDLFFYEKEELINRIKDLYTEKKYSSCISLIGKISKTDDELAYILSDCHYQLGKKMVLNGSLITALKHLQSAAEYSDKTIYDTQSIQTFLPLYIALAKNIQSPLLELDIQKVESSIDVSGDYEFYRYVMNDTSYPYTNSVFSKHNHARELMKKRNYNDALKILCEIVDIKLPSSYNSYVMFGVYTDIEQCYKNLMNFESAYKYASKRLSMLEGFKS